MSQIFCEQIISTWTLCFPHTDTLFPPYWYRVSENFKSAICFVIQMEFSLKHLNEIQLPLKSEVFKTIPIALKIANRKIPLP